MLKTTVLALSIATLSTGATAQCGTLAANGSGAPGSSLELALTGSTPMSFAFLAVGDTLGTTSIEIGTLATLELGIEMPFIPLPLGRTDMNGDASLTIDVPSTVTMGIDLYGQGVGVDFDFGPTGPSLDFCVSNTVAFSLGQ